MRSPFPRERAACCTYRTHVSEGGERDGLAIGVTGFAAPLGGGRAFSIVRAGFGVAAGARTIGFAGVAASR